MSGVMQDEEKSPKWGADHCKKNGNLKIQKQTSKERALGKEGRSQKKKWGSIVHLGKWREKKLKKEKKMMKSENGSLLDVGGMEGR